MVCGNNRKTLSVTKDHWKTKIEKLHREIIELSLDNPKLPYKSLTYHSL